MAAVWEKEGLYSGLGGLRQPVGIWSPKAPPSLGSLEISASPLPEALTPGQFSQVDFNIPEVGVAVDSPLNSLVLVCVPSQEQQHPIPQPPACTTSIE